MFDLIIIGGSAAAASAGIYATRRALNFKIITKDFGGEVATSGEVDNYPGIPGTNGIELADKFKKHLTNYGVIPEEGVEVKKIIRQTDGIFLINAAKEGQDIEYTARAVIVATGVHPRELNIPGEKEFKNKGVSYCTVCDGPVFGGKTVAIIGGGNSALEAGLMMADIAGKVYMLNKNPVFKGDTILLDNLKTKKNVEFIYSVKTSGITGKQFVTGLKYEEGGSEKELKVDGVFVHIGMLPNSGVVPEDVRKNNYGEIVVDKNCQTNIPGLYAAGDVTDVPFKQIVIAAAQGVCALLSAVQYLNKFKQI
ncbi:MAG: FAD-dependent oxidoreductase [Candidatus Yanofskybacteria bacterium]|nr:FAD-dependent oxidoreductase [Candidatus Yanofskybacteria bacterium]